VLLGKPIEAQIEMLICRHAADYDARQREGLSFIEVRRRFMQFESL
jgi:hypothetical protein